jgi:peptidoglycan-N-acetylglucosamine deacetylase
MRPLSARRGDWPSAACAAPPPPRERGHEEATSAPDKVRAMARATCLFRPPYGVLTPDLVQRAKVAGLTTAKWTVDTADWTHPGVSAIRERVLAGARPGSIVVMHDNIETRGQTLAALPSILEGLRARGLHMVTISELLGDKLIWSQP